MVRRISGKLRWVRLGRPSELTIAEARERAREVLKRLDQGLTPVEPQPPPKDSVADVFDNWLRRHIEARGARQRRRIRRVVETLILPRWQERIFAAMVRNASHATDYFHLPSEQVVEIGRQISI